MFFRQILRATAVLVLVAIQSLNAAAANESDVILARWDALAPSIEPYDDPFIDMSLEQKKDLREVLLSLDTENVSRSAAGDHPNAKAARARLEAAGLDIPYLLEQRLLVMERRREEATGVTSTFIDKKVLMDGFVLPLAWKDERVTEFLLVPWVGACIHTPPPAPNQIIHVSFPQGLELKQRFDAVRLEGTLRHQPAAHELFLIDGSRRIPASYGLEGAALTGQPGAIVAASSASIPLLAKAQIWVDSLFSSGMSAIGEEGSTRAILTAILMAFGYGALHTLGPGHGKAVVISYFVGTGGSLRRGLTMGARIAVFHVLSAIVVVFLLDLAVRQTTGAAPSDYRIIRLFSYGLIVAIGTVMLWQAVRAMQAAPPKDSSCAHDHTHTHHGHGTCNVCRTHEQSMGSGWVAAAVGIVPCTGALIVMLFGLANDLIWPAILMVVSISLGMAVAMSALGIAALLGRGWIEQKFSSNADSHHRFSRIAQLTGASVVLALGILLFTATYLNSPTDQLAGKQFTAKSNETVLSGG